MGRRVNGYLRTMYDDPNQKWSTAPCSPSLEEGMLSSQNTFRHERDSKASFPMKNPFIPGKALIIVRKTCGRTSFMFLPLRNSRLLQRPDTAQLSSGHKRTVSGIPSRDKSWAHHSPAPEAAHPPLLLHLLLRNPPAFSSPSIPLLRWTRWTAPSSEFALHTTNEASVSKVPAGSQSQLL